jgi:hypothetical protein
MLKSLSDWENDFSAAIKKDSLSEREKAGSLLPVIPDHSRWDDFMASTKAEWRTWRSDLSKYPSCLVLLYGGIAFYEYEKREFWRQFAECVGSDELPANQQQDINGVFAKATKHFGLKLKLRDNGTDFVGSAVHSIGIPLSLWGGFLDLCEWVLWRRDWKTLSDEEWENVIDNRCGGRQRLKKFLIDNRETASNFVQEMLDAREILTKETGLTIGNIAQASILRVEYFDEVPETAEFLCPQNPDSLFQDRARLIWNEQRRQISVQLPSVEQDKLPAMWRIGDHSQAAAHSPDELTLNSEAFRNSLLLTLESGIRNEVQRLRGVTSWGLFDLVSGGRLVNADRDELPLKSYTLVSRNELEILREGFDEDENPVNEQFELADGVTCFVTHLWPTGKYAEVRVKEVGQTQRVIRFKARARIEARFFTGFGRKAAYFGRAMHNQIKTDHLPILCVTIPNGYFRDPSAILDREFRVFVDSRSAAGQWRRQVRAPTDSEFFRWRWNRIPFLEHKVGVDKLTDLRQLREAFKAPDLRGKHVFAVEAIPHIHAKFDVELVHRSREAIDESWKTLPGAFLPMFLLCQSTEGMKWEDLVLAKDVIAPKSQLSEYLLHKYARHGFLVQRGHRWFINESRAEYRPMNNDRVEMNYCGDPSILWGLYRRMYHQMRGATLPLIEVVDKRGGIPYLRMIWPLPLRGEIEQYLKHHQVVIDAILWTH